MKAVYDVGLLSKIDIPKLYCSPDGIVPITLAGDEYEAVYCAPKIVTLAGDLYFVVRMEIKNRVTNSLISSIMRNSSPTMQTLLLSAPEYKDPVLHEQAVQIIQQTFVLKCNLAFI